MASILKEYPSLHLPYPTFSFLKALWSTSGMPPGSWFELRALPPPSGRQFWPLPLDESIATEALPWARAWNTHGFHVYYGVQPRCRPGGKNEDVAGYVALVTDFDSIEEGEAGLRLLHDADLVPSAVVASGRGLHCYLLLKSLTPVDAARPVGRRLCAWTGSDAVFDAARVMRLPGTINVKPEAAGAPCRLVHLDPELRYSIEDIVQRLDAVGAPQPPEKLVHRHVSASGGSDLAPLSAGDLSPERLLRLHDLGDMLPPRYYELARSGYRPGVGYHSRSEADMAVIRVLMRLGAEDEEIVDFFRLLPNGIGAKTIETGSHYLEFSIEKARATAEEFEPSVVEVQGIKGTHDLDRYLLWLKVLAGPHAGTDFRQGIQTGFSRESEVWPFVFRAAGLRVPPPGTLRELAHLFQRQMNVALRETPYGLEVAAWLPPSRSPSSTEARGLCR